MEGTAWLLPSWTHCNLLLLLLLPARPWELPAQDRQDLTHNRDAHNTRRHQHQLLPRHQSKTCPARHRWCIYTKLPVPIATPSLQINGKLCRESMKRIPASSPAVGVALRAVRDFRQRWAGSTTASRERRGHETLKGEAQTLPYRNAGSLQQELLHHEIGARSYRCLQNTRTRAPKISQWAPGPPPRQCQRWTFHSLTSPLLYLLIYFYSRSFINAVDSPVLSTCPSTVIKH